MKKLAILLFLSIALTLTAGEAKYVFYFIGDGMGTNQILLTEMYRSAMRGEIGRTPLCFTQFPVSTQVVNYSLSNPITDSSAAGTCLATGSKTNNGMLGVDPSGKRLTSIAEVLHQKNWGVGIVTSVSIDHATPGAFYAHSASRKDYLLIGQQLTISGFDFFAGASFKKNGGKKPTLYEQAVANGYRFARGMGEYALVKDSAEKLILVQPNELKKNDSKGKDNLPFAIDRKNGDLSLAEETAAAIEFLSKKDRFFLMVEGGNIDWLCHANDAGSVIREMEDFNQSIALAYQFYMAHPDETLIVVTADHETGGLMLGDGEYELNLPVLQYQKCSSEELSHQLKKMQKKAETNLPWADVRSLLSEKWGFYKQIEISEEEDAALQAAYARMIDKNIQDNKETLYAEIEGMVDAAQNVLAKKAHLSWASTSHSATPIPLFAIGAGADRFAGLLDNTDIVPILLGTTKE